VEYFSSCVPFDVRVEKQNSCSSSAYKLTQRATLTVNNTRTHLCLYNKKFCEELLYIRSFNSRHLTSESSNKHQLTHQIVTSFNKYTSRISNLKDEDI
jgi:hypothetical protein